MIGGGGSRGNDPSNPLVGSNCKGAACDLAGGGGPLTAPPGCGDGVLTNDEACDDGNKVSGDGCAEHCLATEPGFSSRMSR